MPSPRLILDSETLQSGFRDAHNETAGAVPISATIDDAGIVSFFGLSDVLLFTLPLAGVLALANTTGGGGGGGGGSPVEFSSATEETEGVLRLATLEEVITGSNEFKAVTPATLFAALSQLPGASSSRFDLDLDYDVITHALIVSLSTYSRPELKLTGTSSSTTGFVLSTAVSGQPNRYTYTFPGVLTSGRLYIRAQGDSMALGTSIPVIIPELDYSALLDSTEF